MENKHRFISVTLLMVLLFAIFGVSIIQFHLPPFVPLVTAIMVTMIFGRLNHFSWNDLQNQLLSGIQTGLAPIFLFLLIGMLIGLWMAVGVIPTLLWTGLNLANPTWFLPAAFLIPALIGTAIGSAFTTIATVGVALMGVGLTLGFPAPVMAGAIISGAIFGDKSSPLSDSTNLAASIAGTDLFDHIKNLMWTTIPAFVVSLIAFTVLGLQNRATASLASITSLQNQLQPNFWSLLLLVLLFVMAWAKIPAIPTLMINVVLSSFIFLMNHSLTALSDTILNGFKTSADNPTIQALLNRGGMLSMMPTVIIIMLALALGGMLSQEKILQDFMAPVIKRVKTQAATVTGTIITGILANFMIGEQYLATILPGQLWKPVFKRVKLSPLALGRTLEDSGTVMNYLVPWGVAGSFAAQTLNVPVTSFALFAIFAWVSPIFSLISAWTGVGLKQLPDDIN
ncbi:Na+/H+ antiporter NhaC [Weissella viridescens]|uniref:Na+/H+ antiporter NhaC n=1 Tax=Weissella viridescens TaxID=1629 RepID=UPI001D069C5B|nr:Na+/H+ antiporter NhaC [Weissella viridescens]MCB6840924.1 Na+/H+ antiporter NhaC [Weissella viridescens]MCB6847657.1 Na+/H+ antiporter NhaC [Weissella viridescens]WJI90875.1 Na+/H+ antiporter NhaC [Weissella viridescens]